MSENINPPPPQRLDNKEGLIITEYVRSSLKLLTHDSNVILQLCGREQRKQRPPSPAFPLASHFVSGVFVMHLEFLRKAEAFKHDTQSGY